MLHAQQNVTISNEVTDPVCGMQTESPEDYISCDHGGTTFYFCSEHCLEKFKAEPDRYLSKEKDETNNTPSADDTGSATVYTCPMHPEIRQEGPGDCPKCGMALEPDTPGIGETQTQYTCPMHPELVRDGPGECPKCGMALEPKTIAPEGKKTANTCSCASASG